MKKGRFSKGIDVEGMLRSIDPKELLPAVDSLTFCGECTGLHFFQDGIHNLVLIGAPAVGGPRDLRNPPTINPAIKVAHVILSFFPQVESERLPDRAVPGDCRQSETVCRFHFAFRLAFRLAFALPFVGCFLYQHLLSPRL